MNCCTLRASQPAQRHGDKKSLELENQRQVLYDSLSGAAVVKGSNRKPQSHFPSSLFIEAFPMSVAIFQAPQSRGLLKTHGQSNRTKITDLVICHLSRDKRLRKEIDGWVRECDCGSQGSGDDVNQSIRLTAIIAGKIQEIVAGIDLRAVTDALYDAAAESLHTAIFAVEECRQEEFKEVCEGDIVDYGDDYRVVSFPGNLDDVVEGAALL